uniref:Uncharacterized protein n=1 Tax=Denticeps clupeoides TaxID=299321 RepID=A0AAY4A556_9TELE
MVQTMQELLKSSRFERPNPRHGLRLLYWFAKDCVEFDQNDKMEALCDPTEEESGFKWFRNNCRDGALIPDVNAYYYEVGNLHGDKVLPEYVKKNYGDNSASNKDRIFVSYKSGFFDSVYVAEHIDRGNFDRSHTLQISKGLLRTIKNTELTRFLSQMNGTINYLNGSHGFAQRPPPVIDLTSEITWSRPQNQIRSVIPPETDPICSCTIL